ncbi:MAG TPA: alpha/beta fold hydrolase [Candidatus Limnocylindrales bacterium]|nr:alpha/beta fold hydrolase [Candidatus Limnocylindrales bacterium]
MVRDDVGTGPPLVLLHGLAGSARWWSRNVPALSRSFRLVTIDLPGFGASPRGQRLDLEGIVEQLAGTLDGLGIERASLVGHSMGGLIAGGMAADRPDRVERLILVNAAFLSLAPAGARSVTGPATTLRRTAPSLLPVLVADGIRSGPLRLTDASLQLLRADWRTKLPKIAAPTLVIWGEHDRICPLAIGEQIVAAVTGARLVVVEGAAHNPMWERPDEFNRLVLAFLGE